MPDSRIPALFVVSGLVDGALPATSVPAPEIARLQLRALQHRHLHAGLDPEGGLIEVLTHDDFVGIGADGAWLTRSPFIAHVSRRPEPTAAPARFDDEAVRLFGPVAVVHGVFAGPSGALRCTDVHLWCGTGWRLVSTQESPLAAGVAHGLFHGAAPAIPAWQGQDPTGDDEARADHAQRSVRARLPGGRRRLVRRAPRARLRRGGQRRLLPRPRGRPRPVRLAHLRPDHGLVPRLTACRCAGTATSRSSTPPTATS
jgi:hypothetical protein